MFAAQVSARRTDLTFGPCSRTARHQPPSSVPRPGRKTDPALLLRTLLLAALLLSGIRCVLAQPRIGIAQPRIGIAYCDLDHLYDTIPALFYDDSDYTPGGRLAWDTERYRRKIARTAAVIDSMRMPLVALWSVENEAVVRDIAAAVGIKDASLYNHFSGKQAIFDAMHRI